MTPAPPSESNPPIAVAAGAAKVFPSGDGVRDLDLSIPHGSIFGFIGPSGSGKTTTVRMFTGAAVPTAGRVDVFGRNPARFDTATRARIGYMPQRSVLYPDLSVLENLRFLASLYGPPDDRRLAEVLEFVELTGHASKKVRETSGGMQRRLSLAGALAHDPDVVFLDEPTAGIDPVLRRKFWDHFTALTDDDHTLFVTTQYVGEAAYCDYVGVLADGRLVTVETPEGLRRAAYGGDLIDLAFRDRPPPELLAEVQEFAGALSATSSSPLAVRLVVDEAATVLPALGAWLGERRIEIEMAEEHIPPFDDVFVKIVERHRAEAAA